MSLNLILIQLYWFSFSLIGVALLLGLRRLQHKRPVKSAYYEYLRRRHWLVLTFIANCLALAWFGLALTPAYIFSWPTQVLIWFYLFTLLVGLVVIISEWKTLLRYLKRQQLPTKHDLWWLLPVVAAVLFTYGLALYHTGSLGFDSQIHMARLTSIADGRISFKDPYFGYHGVYDVRYSINLITSLMGLGAKMLHLSSLDFWLYSYAWLLVLTSVGIFSFCREIYSGEYNRLISYASLALGPFLLTAQFWSIEMPSKQAILWLMLLMIGLKLLYEKGSAGLLLLAALLLAMTQAIDCAMAVSFLGLLALGLAITKNLSRRLAMALLAAIMIMSVPLLLQLYYPNLLKFDPAAFNAEAGTLNTIKPQHYGPLIISTIRPLFSRYQFLAYLAILGGLFFSKRIKNKFVLLTLALIILTLDIVAYSSLLVILIGFVYLLTVVHSKPLRVTIAAAGIYYSLIAYNPVIIRLAAGRIPFWLLARLQDLNVFVFLTLFIGLFVLHIRPVVGRRLNNLEQKYYALLAVEIIVVAFIFKAGWRPIFADLFAQPKRIAYAQRIEAFQDQLKGKLIMSDDPQLAIRVPSLIPTSAISYKFDPSAAPMSNLPRRKACNVQLVARLDEADILAAGVNTIITSSTDHAFSRLIDSKPFIKLVARDNNFSVYSINLPPQPTLTNSICAIPYGQ